MRSRFTFARKALIVAAAAATLVVSTGIISVLAVHDKDFQLDGDVRQSDGAHTLPVDWDTLFNNDTTEKALPANFTASTFAVDFQTTTKRGQLVFATADDTTFATGSKDTLDINPGWQCSKANNVLTKNDIMNTYAASYTNPTTLEQYLYFGMERNGNNGDANVAFWFLQSDANCDASNGTAAWIGNHVDGDVLIVSAFSNGGGVSTIDAYKWSDADGPGGTPGFLNTTPVGSGGDCASNLGNDAICATTNGSSAGGLNANITTPWKTANSVDGYGNTLRPSEFFEGGVNLSFLELDGSCFNTFVGDTRSSTSLTATIFDYARGVLGQCTSTTTTSPVDATDTTKPPATTIPGDPDDAVVTVKDRTVIDVTGIATFSGSITWNLCGPTAAASLVTCDSGGVSIGSQNITAEGTYYSPTARVTAAGRYCFRAEFSGDLAAGVPGSSDHSATECFTVAPRRASISTQAGAGPVDFGNAVTDVATLTNTAHKPGSGGPTGSLLAGSINPTTLGGDATGTITFTLYKSDCTTIATGTGTNPQPVSVSGNGTYNASFTPDAPGTYYWVATYSGDTPNTLASLASDSPCPDSNEDVVVRQIPTGVISKQDWIPNDTATVSSSVGNLAAGGSAVFELWNTATCDGTKLYTQTVPVPGGSPTAVVNTTNTGTGAGMLRISTDYADAANSTKSGYSWKVTYTPAVGDTAHLGSSSTCAAENFSITYTNDNTP